MGLLQERTPEIGGINASSYLVSSIHYCGGSIHSIRYRDLSARKAAARFREGGTMKKSMILGGVLLALASMTAPAAAKGCIKGAVIGGAAGHFVAHHGVLGAIAGCVIGYHEANKTPRPNPNHTAQRTTRPPQ
jgi:hypothetical protein